MCVCVCVCVSIESNDEEVAIGVAQLAAFQVVLIFTAVAAILALTRRLRVFSSHEPTRLKVYFPLFTRVLPACTQ